MKTNKIKLENLKVKLSLQELKLIQGGLAGIAGGVIAGVVIGSAVIAGVV